jgi:hypothetical protein
MKKKPLAKFIKDSSDALEYIFQFVTNPDFQRMSQIILDENNTIFSKYTEDYEEEELRNQDRIVGIDYDSVVQVTANKKMLVASNYKRI